MTGFGSSLIRTYVPMVVALLVGWLTSLGVDITDQQKAALVAGISTVAGALYYLLARLLEKQFPWATVLLGSSVQPVAYQPAATAADALPVLPVEVDAPVDAELPPLPDLDDDDAGKHEA